MRVLHVSTNDITGGAARAAYRLHQALLRIDINSMMLVLNKASHDPHVVEYRPSSSFFKRLYRKIRRRLIVRSYRKYKKTRPKRLEVFSDSRSPFTESMKEELAKADIVNMHWVAQFVDYEHFFSIVPDGVHVVWTLHDMNPFTGGCHYAGDCIRYLEQCGSCPQLGSHNEDDLSRLIWHVKKNAYSKKRFASFHIVTPSKWLAGEAGKSALFKGLPVTTIPNGLDLELFKPRDATSLRDALQIPLNTIVIGFVADSTTNKRKGFAMLTKALESLKVDNITLLSIGADKPSIGGEINHIHLGKIKQDGLMSLMYSLFDIFVCPSLEDNLPNTVIESLACGTPIAGFNIGGMPDMVEHGVTGFLAYEVNAQSLALCIGEMIHDKGLIENMGGQCRKKALNEYEWTQQANNYDELYHSLINRNHEVASAIC